MAASLCLMPEPAAPFAVDPATVAHALVPAQPAAANMLRVDRLAGDHLALLVAAAAEDVGIGAGDVATETSGVDATSLLAVCARACAGS